MVKFVCNLLIQLVVKYKTLNVQGKAKKKSGKAWQFVRI